MKSQFTLYLLLTIPFLSLGGVSMDSEIPQTFPTLEEFEADTLYNTHRIQVKPLLEMDTNPESRKQALYQIKEQKEKGYFSSVYS